MPDNKQGAEWQKDNIRYKLPKKAGCATTLTCSLAGFPSRWSNWTKSDFFLSMTHLSESKSSSAANIVLCYVMNKFSTKLGPPLLSENMTIHWNRFKTSPGFLQPLDARPISHTRPVLHLQASWRRQRCHLSNASHSLRQAGRRNAFE